MIRTLSSLIFFPTLVAAGAAAFALAATGADDTQKKAAHNFTVHEWGTFTTLAGSSGLQLEGLGYDDEALPKFVYHYNKQEADFSGVGVKMETPVIYFYSKEERTVSVEVGFPQGILTQWYPQVRNLEPKVTHNPALKNGKLYWGEVRLLAPNPKIDPLPRTSPGEIWNHARETDANIIRICNTGGIQEKKNEYEKFLFYRGLGNFELPLTVNATDESLNIQNTGSEPLNGAVLLKIENGRLAISALGDLAKGGITAEFAAAKPSTVEHAMELVAKNLVAAGLFPKEADAMVKTWRHNYFETDGVRILYIVPRTLTDRLLPLKLDPAPENLVRVLVGRFDVLTPSMEQRAEQLAKTLTTTQGALQSLGRFAEPILERIYKNSKDDSARKSAGMLLAMFNNERGC